MGGRRGEGESERDLSLSLSVSQSPSPIPGLQGALPTGRRRLKIVRRVSLASPIGDSFPKKEPGKVAQGTVLAGRWLPEARKGRPGDARWRFQFASAGGGLFLGPAHPYPPRVGHMQSGYVDMESMYSR